MIRFDDMKNEELLKGIESMVILLQSVQVKMQQAVHALTSTEYLVECTKDHVTEEAEEEIDEEMIDSLETVQKNLLDATHLKKETTLLTTQYEQYKKQNAILEVIRT